MTEKIKIFKSDGTYVDIEANVVENTMPYTPTTEDRLSALESAMLSMMGVSTDV